MKKPIQRFIAKDKIKELYRFLMLSKKHSNEFDFSAKYSDVEIINDNVLLVTFLGARYKATIRYDAWVHDRFDITLYSNGNFGFEMVTQAFAETCRETLTVIGKLITSGFING